MTRDDDVELASSTTESRLSSFLATPHTSLPGIMPVCCLNMLRFANYDRRVLVTMLRHLERAVLDPLRKRTSLQRPHLMDLTCNLENKKHLRRSH